MKEKITPDRNKAQMLIEVASVTNDRLNEIPFLKYPSNTLIDVYDIVHKLIDSIFLVRGIKFRGDSAHYELFDEVGKLGFLTGAELTFVQQLRKYRNRVQYEGFQIPKVFIQLNEVKIKDLIIHLFEIAEIEINSNFN